MASGRSARLPPTPTQSVRNPEISPETGYSAVSATTTGIPGNTINALGPELAVATSQVLDNLSDKERQMILEVLNRDEGVRQRDAARIMLLRAELQNLRRKGAWKTGGSLDRPQIEVSRYCARCGTELGRIINRGAPCRVCRFRVCKACREFTTRTTDWVCLVCHKQMELKAASGEWLNDVSHGPQRCRRGSVTKDNPPSSDIVKKSIRRSWTISNPEDDNNPLNRQGGDYQAGRVNLGKGHSAGSYPSLVRHPTTYKTPNMDYDPHTEIYPPRRMLRQSTLPSNLPNPDASNYYSNSNLTAPSSPKCQISPSYSTYPENEPPQASPLSGSDKDMQPHYAPQQHPAPHQQRFTMRRQSTLPCRPTDQQQGHLPIYMSTSPNRNFSRSPERPDAEQRYPPFVRQSTFPSNTTDQHYPPPHRPKMLPTSPCRSPYNSQYMDEASDPRPRVIRQATLPNPDQHMKLLPTSPPKRQPSPQYMKRSPDFIRQNTLPNPEGFNSLTVHQANNKFLPISPRQKHNFLFPNPHQPSHPRQFLSQQNVPTVEDGEHYASSQSVNIQGRDGAKMMKVRSHSNEEYSASRPAEARRILPEIPLNRSSRSISRLVRQDHVKEDASSRVNQDATWTPGRRTFAEAKQNLPEYDPQQQDYADYYDENSFLEADEVQYEKKYGNYSSEPKIIYNDVVEEEPIVTNGGGHSVRSVESFLNDTQAAYQEEVIRTARKDRQRRRRSRELTEADVITSSNDEEPMKRKPETMRSVSEDSGTKAPVKPVTRRSLSHPEKESQKSKRNEPTKIPSPKPLIDLSEKAKKPTKLPTPKRRTCKVAEHAESLPPDEAIRPAVPQRRNSSNFTDKNDGSNERNQSSDHNSPAKDVGDEDDDGKANHDQNKDAEQDMDASTVLKAWNQQEHKTTLGEAEIQSAVEAAAVVFKKVVLQRRKEKKDAEEISAVSVAAGGASAGDCFASSQNRFVAAHALQDEIVVSSDYESAAALRMFYPECDEYKLVFISSDSSSKEEEEEFEDSSSTTSSTHNRGSIILDDCDWDYFEPGTALTKSTIFRASSPCGSPLFYRRAVVSSVSSGRSSSLFGSRASKVMRESDTGTDEEMLMQAESSTSPTSSDGFLNNGSCLRNRMKTKFLRHHQNHHAGAVSSRHHHHHHQPSRAATAAAIEAEATPSSSGGSCSCGGGMGPGRLQQPQYVPIPVAVPIPVPISAFRDFDFGCKAPAETTADGGGSQQGANLTALQQRQAVDLFQLWNSAAPGLLLQRRISESLGAHAPLAKAPGFGLDSSLGASPCAAAAGSEQVFLQRAVADMFRNSKYGGDDSVLGAASSTGPVPPPSRESVANASCAEKELAGSSSSGGEFIVGALSSPAGSLEYAANNDNDNNSNDKDNDHDSGLSSCDNGKSDKIRRRPSAVFSGASGEVAAQAEVAAAATPSSSHNSPRTSDNSASVGNSSWSGGKSEATTKNTCAGSNSITGENPPIDSKPQLAGDADPTLPTNEAGKGAVGGRKPSKRHKMISVGKIKSNPVAQTAGGYLVSDYIFSSSSSDSESDDSGHSNHCSGDKEDASPAPAKRSIQRSYDVASASQHEDLIVDSSGSNQDHYTPSTARENVSDNSDSDSNHGSSSSSSSESVDTDDTGTIADRRPKAKSFSKVFVVNKSASSSEEETDSQSSDANLEDSSDNDTDTERTDCGIVLNYVKALPEDTEESASDSDDSVVSLESTNEVEFLQDGEGNDASLLGQDDDECVVLNSIRTISFDGTNGLLLHERPQSQKSERILAERTANVADEAPSAPLDAATSATQKAEGTAGPLSATMGVISSHIINDCDVDMVDVDADSSVIAPAVSCKILTNKGKQLGAADSGHYLGPDVSQPGAAPAGRESCTLGNRKDDECVSVDAIGSCDSTVSGKHEQDSTEASNSGNDDPDDQFYSLRAVIEDIRSFDNDVLAPSDEIDEETKIMQDNEERAVKSNIAENQEEASQNPSEHAPSTAQRSETHATVRVHELKILERTDAAGEALEAETAKSGRDQSRELQHRQNRRQTPNNGEAATGSTAEEASRRGSRSHDQLTFEEFAQLEAISNDLNDMLAKAAPASARTDQLVEKLIKDVASINKNHLRRGQSKSCAAAEEEANRSADDDDSERAQLRGVDPDVIAEHDDDDDREQVSIINSNECTGRRAAKVIASETTLAPAVQQPEADGETGSSADEDVDRGMAPPPQSRLRSQQLGRAFGQDCTQPEAQSPSETATTLTPAQSATVQERLRSPRSAADRSQVAAHTCPGKSAGVSSGSSHAQVHDRREHADRGRVGELPSRHGSDDEKIASCLPYGKSSGDPTISSSSSQMNNNTSRQWSRKMRGEGDRCRNHAGGEGSDDERNWQSVENEQLYGAEDDPLSEEAANGIIDGATSGGANEYESTLGISPCSNVSSSSGSSISAKYRSLVMITTADCPQDYIPPTTAAATPFEQVNIVTSETTHVVLADDSATRESNVVVQHTTTTTRGEMRDIDPNNSGNSGASMARDYNANRGDSFKNPRSKMMDRAMRFTTTPDIGGGDGGGGESVSGRRGCDLRDILGNNNDRDGNPISIHRMQNNSSSNCDSRSDSVVANCSGSGSSSSSIDDVTVVTGADTLSAVVCLEDGLADDDSWVEEISHDEEEFAATTTATDSDMDSGGEDIAMTSSMSDREEELRGYNRTAIDFTLHTIVEESCEESEVEQNHAKKRKNNNRSSSELEKYFYYGLGDGKPMSSIDDDDTREAEEQTASEDDESSICSEGLDSLGIPEEPIHHDLHHAAELASSRLEKYFLTSFMGFSQQQQERTGGGGSDESEGSVGSDSEGHPSPGQRRKRLVRARGTPRSHNSSLDNLLAAATKDNDNELGASEVHHNESNDSSESESCDDTLIHLEKVDSSNDTIKRKKQQQPSRKRHDSDEKKSLEFAAADHAEKVSAAEPKSSGTSQEFLLPAAGYSNLAQSRKQHSRDSGFIGSNDDLLKGDDAMKSPELMKMELDEIKEDHQQEANESEQPQKPTMKGHQQQHSGAKQEGGGLTRKDSFNNWSSDEETNLMMSKMRQIIKTLIAASANAQNIAHSSSKNSTPVVSGTSTPTNNQTTTATPVPTRPRNNKGGGKSPQLAYFESELTRLMKTVPGINDDQVREIVEYLSSEDTWSDSYDSSDYTSSDLEGAAAAIRTHKAELKEQISASCQQIINKFDGSANDEEGDRGDGGVIDEIRHPETAIVYQKLVASFSKIASGSAGPSHASQSSEPEAAANKSPQLLAKVMHHIGSRLVALMHEVSSGESLHGNSPAPQQQQRYHKKAAHQKNISVTTTEDDDDSTSDSSNIDKSASSFIHLPRSKSHDLLLSEPRPQHHQSSSGVSDTAGEEKEASDYERFSWRGSFESALLANGDSRTKLTTLLDRDNSASASALAAKRRSAGDLLFSPKSLSREQLDRVRSCGSIGGAGGTTIDDDEPKSKIWEEQGSNKNNNQSTTGHRRSSVPDVICESGNSSEGEEDGNQFPTRSTLPRSLQATSSSASTNSLPRMSTTPMQKSLSVYQFLPNSVKSARYRPSGLSGVVAVPAAAIRSNSVPKKSSSTPGLQQLFNNKRDVARRLNYLSGDDTNPAEICNSPLIGTRNKSGSASPIASHGSASSDPWPSQSEEDIDRLVALHQNRNSLSSLGLRSDSMASVYSGAGDGRYGTVAVKGQIEFGMQYNYKQSALEIHVVRCKELAAVDAKRNRSDPYVKLYLLPDKSKGGKRKTKVKKHTLNPVFDETLKFHMPLSNLESRTLWLTVWHSDMFGRNDFLGEVTISLQGRVFDNPQSQWYTLQERTEPYDDLSVYRGDIIVGLKFVPPESSSSRQSTSRGSNSNLRKFGSIKSSSKNSSSKGQLHILVKEAKNLSPVKANGTCDAFCKSYLLPDRTRGSKQKTPVAKKTIHPSWNYTFVYEDVSLQELSERALELTVWDHDRLASNEFLGGVRFSLGAGKHYGKSVDWMDATGKELSLWQNMLNRPNFWVEGCLVLRSSLDVGSKSPQ